MQHDDIIMHQLTLLGLSRNHHIHQLTITDITRSSQDPIKNGINNVVVIITWPQGAWSLPTILAQHHEYPTTRYPRYHGDHLMITNGITLGSTGYLVTKRWSFRRSQPWPTLGLKRWSFRRSQPTYLILEPGLLFSTLLLLLLTHSVTDYELGPYLRAWLLIDLNTHSAEVSTLYSHHGTHGLALPFRWTNGVLTKPIYCHDTLPATPTHSPLG